MSDLEDLKQKAQLALGDVRFVEIVKDAPLNSKGAVNISHVEREALAYAMEQTGSAKTAELFRKSAVALAVLRRDHNIEFHVLSSEALTRASEREARENQQEEKPSFTPIEGREFLLPAVDVIFRPRLSGGYTELKTYMRFWSLYTHEKRDIMEFVSSLLEAVLDDNFDTYNYVTQYGGTEPVYNKATRKRLADLATRLLEEKFGMEVSEARKQTSEVLYIKACPPDNCMENNGELFDVGDGCTVDGQPVRVVDRFHATVVDLSGDKRLVHAYRVRVTKTQEEKLVLASDIEERFRVIAP